MNPNPSLYISLQSDELRLDVNFRRSIAILSINNVFLHEFSLNISVPLEFRDVIVSIEDFVLGLFLSFISLPPLLSLSFLLYFFPLSILLPAGCVLTPDIECKIIAERLSVPNTRERIERIVFQREKLEEDLIAEGAAMGLQFKGKPKLLVASELKQSPNEKRRNKSRKKGMQVFDLIVLLARFRSLFLYFYCLFSRLRIK